MKSLDRMTKHIQYENSNSFSHKKFKIVRIKDRLDLSSRDIMINAKIEDSPVFEIQLSVSNQV